MISIIKSPPTYTPVGNPNIWQIQSNNSSIVYFNVKVIEAESEAVIVSQKYFPTPYYISGASFNLSGILTNYVDAAVDNDSTVVKAVSGSTLAYRLIITENVIDNYLGEFVDGVLIPNPTAGQIIEGASYDDEDDVYTVWDSEIDKLSFYNYSQNDFVINDSSLAKFLSVKPKQSKQTGTSTEHLYFLNDNWLAKNARIKCYDYAGVYQYTVDIPITEGLLIRLNVSPKVLFSEYDIDFSTIGFYTVALINNSNDVISETKTYKYISDRCSLQPVNFLFTNSLGGVESFVFFNPKETINYTKTYLKTNDLQLTDGSYTDNVNGIFNQSQKTINVNSTSTFTVFSDLLTEEETVYLRELIASKNVYIELNDNETLVPVRITNTNYQVLLRKTNGHKFNRLEISYESQSGHIPENKQIQILNPFMTSVTEVDYGYNNPETSTGCDNEFGYVEPIEDDLDLS